MRHRQRPAGRKLPDRSELAARQLAAKIAADLGRREAQLLGTDDAHGTVQLVAGEIDRRVGSARDGHVEVSGSALDQPVEPVGAARPEPIHVVENEQAGRRMQLYRARQQPHLLRSLQRRPSVERAQWREIHARMVEGAGDKAGKLARRIVDIQRQPGDDGLFPLLTAYLSQQRGLAESGRRLDDGETPLQQGFELWNQSLPAHMAGRQFRDRELHI